MKDEGRPAPPAITLPASRRKPRRMVKFRPVAAPQPARAPASSCAGFGRGEVRATVRPVLSLYIFLHMFQ